MKTAEEIAGMFFVDTGEKKSTNWTRLRDLVALRDRAVIDRCAQEALPLPDDDLESAYRRIRALAAPPVGPQPTPTQVVDWLSAVGHQDLSKLPAEPDFTPRGTALWNEVIGVVFQVSTQELPTNLATAAIVRIFERHQQAAAPPAGIGAEAPSVPTVLCYGPDPCVDHTKCEQFAKGVCRIAPTGTGGRR